MSSTDASFMSEAPMTADDPSFLSKTPDQVETGIAREIRKCLPVLNARDTAAIAMVPVRPVLEAMAAEIARLHDTITEGVKAATAEQFEGVIRAAADEVVKGKLAEIEASVRAAERAQCARQLRAAGFASAANVIDPLGPLQGARAAGGTE